VRYVLLGCRKPPEPKVHIVVEREDVRCPRHPIHKPLHPTFVEIEWGANYRRYRLVRTPPLYFKHYFIRYLIASNQDLDMIADKRLFDD
jgi:hypothetical protein